MVYEFNSIPLPGHDDKQIVDMGLTFSPTYEGDFDAEDNLIRWNCRRNRLALLTMIDPDTIEEEERENPTWAKGKFGMEIDTNFMEPVFAFTGDIDVDWTDDIRRAEFALVLTDTINGEIANSIGVWVNPKHTRLPCRIVGTNGRMDGRIGPALGPPPRPVPWVWIPVYTSVNVVEQEHEKSPQMLTYAGDCTSFDSLTIQWADSTADGDSLPPPPPGYQLWESHQADDQWFLTFVHNCPLTRLFNTSCGWSL